MTPIPLYARGGAVVAWAVVDAADEHMVQGRRWRLSAHGYACAGSPKAGTYVLLHRLLLGLADGNPFQGDHRNGDRLDNRRSNLRVVTNAQNAQNMAARRGGTSKHRGVSRRKDTGRWAAYVKVAGKRYSAGCFDTEDQAAAAVRALRFALMPFDEPARHG